MHTILDIIWTVTKCAFFVYLAVFIVGPIASDIGYEWGRDIRMKCEIKTKVMGSSAYC